MSVVSEIPAQDWALWRAWVSMNQQLSRALDRQLQQDAGISQADYLVLLTLFESPEHRRRIGELAELIAWEKSRVSHQVARMEARALLGAMKEHTAAIRELFFAELSDDEKTAIHAAAQRVLDKLNPVACELSREAEAVATA
jgi:DNA-binding MarR family transcriptional regulator